jgi:predicted nucleic acid-binding protein
MSAEFCDTNIIVYAYDSTAGVKHDRAQALLERLWVDGVGALSVQVLQELFVTLTRKVVRPVDHGEARAIVADLATWSLVQPTASDVLAAIDATIRWKLSFWDAMILTAAQRAGAAVLWSEDFSDGQRFDAVTIRNPFAA